MVDFRKVFIPLLIVQLVTFSLASRVEQGFSNNAGHFLSSHNAPASLGTSSRLPVTQQEQQQQQHQNGRQEQQAHNVEMPVDYADEYDEQAGVAATPSVTYSAPAQQHHKRPSKSPASSHASSSRHAAADALVAAMDDAWRKSKQLATRLASAGSDEAAELMAELEATMDSIADVQGAVSSVMDPIDHRWEVFERNSPPWSVLRADIIDPAREHVSGLDDYEPTDASGVSNDASSNLDYEDIVGMLPDDPPLPERSHAARREATTSSATGPLAVDDIGMLILPEDNAANNLALFGARAPAEITHREHADSEWGSMLQSLLPAPIDVAGALEAVAVVLVCSTVMVLVAFAVSLWDLQAAVQDTPNDAPADHSSADSMCSNGVDTAEVRGARAARLHLHGALFSRQNTAGVAAAFAASGLGASCVSRDCLDESDAAALTEPLLLDSADVEAPFLDAQASSTLPPSVLKFYNPLHYQQLPGETASE